MELTKGTPTKLAAEAITVTRVIQPQELFGVGEEGREGVNRRGSLIIKTQKKDTSTWKWNNEANHSNLLFLILHYVSPLFSRTYYTSSVFQ